MSTEEQMSAVGRLAMERSEAKRQMILLGHEAEKLGKIVVEFGGPLIGSCNAESASRALRSLTAFIESGGDSRLRSVLADYISLNSQVSDISVKLRAAGID